jgi:hypothetical protein
MDEEADAAAAPGNKRADAFDAFVACTNGLDPDLYLVTLDVERSKRTMARALQALALGLRLPLATPKHMRNLVHNIMLEHKTFPGVPDASMEMWMLARKAKKEKKKKKKGLRRLDGTKVRSDDDIER